jgi:hypothetical protein
MSKEIKEVKVKELNKNDRVFIKNTCPWPIGFRMVISNGEISMPANGKTSMVIEEIIALCANSNVFFAGLGEGDHARIYIEDESVRRYVGYDTDSKSQYILTDEECQRILDYKTLATFKKHLEECVVVNHEKAKMMAYARKAKLNNYDYILEIEKHCGMKFKQD